MLLNKEYNSKTTLNKGGYMKWVGIVTCLILITSSGNAQNITVKADKNPDTDLNEYKTFYWASHADNQLNDGVIYFLNDLALKQDIREAVGYELESRGYKEDETNPDMVVNFRIFDKPVTLTGYESYGTSYWSGEQIRNREDIATYEVEAGTVLVSLLDRESGDILWQGFASGLVDGDAFVKDENKIKEAVHLIFEEYGFRANEYSSR